MLSGGFYLASAFAIVFRARSRYDEPFSYLEIMKILTPWPVLVFVGWFFVADATWCQTTDQPDDKAPPASNLPPIEKISEGYEKIVSTVDGGKSFYTIWRRKKDAQLLAELPKDFAREKHYIAVTLASGESYAGLQVKDFYVYWREYGDRLALVVPNLSIRSTGDDQSKASVKRLFTDRVLLDVPILTRVRNGGPVIDLDQLLVEHADQFFGPKAKNLRKNLVSIKTAKAFPENVEIGLEIPAEDGQLRTYHYSVSLIKENQDYKTRLADERVGFFTTSYTDYGKYRADETTVRFVNRWQLEKADKSLKLSPPKEPIIFYLEHTTPIRYRRWVRSGVEMWNEAFQNVGLINAIEVRQQDAATGEHMEKDPEDVRYNFVRWLNNGVGLAIGPSRVNPTTGQILDADIILTDGWIRHYWTQFHEVLPELAVEGYSPETLAWLYRHPTWDPRVRLAAPQQREVLFESRSHEPLPALGGHPVGRVSNGLMGEEEYDGLVGQLSQRNGFCTAANCQAQGMALKHMLLTVEEAEAKKTGQGTDPDKKKAPEEQMLDGIPESFVGPLMASLVSHEVGHTLGLRHNFKASSVYSMAEINSSAMKGKKPFAGSVMDYIPVNINLGSGEAQGDYAMRGVGPYDKWAIEYGYTFADDLKPVLARVAEPELAYATDEDTWGPDPYATRYDFAKDPLSYAENQMRLVNKNRAAIVKSFVKDGESWAKARRGYELTLSVQVQAVNMMAHWIGGTFIYRDKKGDPKGRVPIEVVAAEQQRKALRFVMDNAFRDDAFGLTPELLRHMSVDKWWDTNTTVPTAMEDSAWPIHDRILGIQAAVLTSLMKPSTLGRVHDNEVLMPSQQDALTLPELLEILRGGIWGKVEEEVNSAQAFSARNPAISSLKRNLQKEYVERLVDLLGKDNGLSVAQKPVQDLAATQLEQIHASVGKAKDNPKLDPYTRAHLLEMHKRIQKVLDAVYVVKM